ncbi:23S rRNA (uracil-5-)-methyltransferase RumB, partial [Yersinia pestis PY-66]
MRTVYGRA